MALAVTTATRTPVLPNVPTVGEAALPGFEYQDWWGVFAPVRTPATIIDKVSRETARILERADVGKQLRSLGAEARPSSPDEFGRFVRTKIEGAGRVIKLAGIRVE